jgi:hypothetical protein
LVVLQLRAITSSVFNIVCNLPSEDTNLPQHPFYGMSPTGLARGGSDLSDYEGMIKMIILYLMR